MNLNLRPGWNRLLYTIGAGSLLVIALGVGVRLFQQWQIQQAQLKAFESLKTLAAQPDGEACLQAAQAIEPSSPFYAQAQPLADQCTLNFGKALADKGQTRPALSLLLSIKDTAAPYKEAQQLADRITTQVLDKATAQVLDGKLEEGQATLATLPPESPAQATAKNLQQSWKKQWEDNTAAIAQAQKHLNNQEWAAAKDALKKVTLTPYWRTQIAPLQTKAEEGIAAVIAYEQEQERRRAQQQQKPPKPEQSTEFTQRLQSLYDTYVKQGMDELSAWTTACKTVGGTVDDAGPDAVCKPGPQE